MIKWKLKSYEGNIAVYMYQPCGKGTWGEISIDRNTGEVKLLLEASESNERLNYKALEKLKIKGMGDILLLEFTQAWG